MVDCLLRCRADVNLSFHRSMPPLFGAAHTGRLELVQKLLAERADVNAPWTGKMLQEICGSRVLSEIFPESCDIRP